jgi:hypothetical protein
MSIPFGGSTLIVGAIVFALTIVVGWRRPFTMLAVLILGLPFRDFATRWLNVHTDLSIETVTAIGRWWVFLILALLLVWGVRWMLRVRGEGLRVRFSWMDTLFGLSIVIGLVYTLIAPHKLAAITSLRGYLQPLAVFVLARVFKPSRGELRAFLVLLLIVGVAMAGFGIWQATMWSEADYRAGGYVQPDGRLVSPSLMIRGEWYVRPASFVSGPNELGVDMVILTMVALSWFVEERRARRYIFLLLGVIFAACMAVTMSRSAFLAFLLAIGVFGLMLLPRLRDRILRPMKNKWLLPAALGVGLVIVVGVLQATGFLAFIGRTLTGLTTEFHFVDSVEATRFLAQNPGGVGMGRVTPKGALIFQSIEAAYHVEGSLFQIAMEMGVWGLAIWLAFIAMGLGITYRNWRTVEAPLLRIITGTAFTAWLGALVAFLFLPLMQSISLMCWLWFLLGVGVSSGEIDAAWRGQPDRA